jgi:hypothetical protein
MLGCPCSWTKRVSVGMEELLSAKKAWPHR